MLVNGRYYRSIWFNDEENCVCLIDQTKLPFRFEVMDLKSLEDVVMAIKTMQVRGAPLIGAVGSFGLYFACLESADDHSIERAAEKIIGTRPTAVNLRWAVERILKGIRNVDPDHRAKKAYSIALQLVEEDVKINESIGNYGLSIIQNLYEKKKETIHILTHCNAGWLATVDWGTALAPIYKAAAADIPVHVWVGETRPRNQGMFLTAWELYQQGISHTVIVDNVGGHLMQHGKVDLVLVGSDRTTRTGDVCNKIGTYLKALAAFDNDVPFYVALPISTIDFSMEDGLREIPIETRSEKEVTHLVGAAEGQLLEISLCPPFTKSANYAFDVTPARLISGLITEKGICGATATEIANLR